MSARRAVLVKWRDAITRDGWHESSALVHHISGMADVLSIGFVLAESRDGIVLACGLGDDGATALQCLQIPRGMIQEVIEIDLAGVS